MTLPHSAALAEDWVNGVLDPAMRLLHWRNQTIAYAGYANEDMIRVLARVLLAPRSRSPDVPESGPAKVTMARRRGWRAFLTVPVTGAQVVVRVGARRHMAYTDRGGYLDTVIHGHDLQPGWRSVAIEVDGAEPVLAPIRVVDPGVRVGLVSDIDDTVMVTSLPRPMIAVWNTIVVAEHARHVVPGMASTYRALLAQDPGAPIFYLSTGAWNVAPLVARFLRRGGFPPGPMLLTDWGPTNTGWFRSGREHKRAALRRLAADFPQIRWILIGDDGQNDPALYAEFAARAPEHTEAIAIRELTPTEQLLSHGLLPPIQEPRSRRDILVAHAPDGYALLEALRRGRLVRGSAPPSGGYG